MTKKLKITFIFITTLLLFIALTTNSGVWHKTYFIKDTARRIVGDSSSIYAVFDRQNSCQIFNSTDLGDTWERIYYEWDGGKPLPTPPYSDVVDASYPAPGFMYILYAYDGLRHIDERTGEIITEIDFFPEISTYDKVRSSFSNISMLDSINGIVSDAYYFYVTKDGWQTYNKSIFMDTLIDEIGDTIINVRHIQHSKMISKDTVLCLGVLFEYNSSTGETLSSSGLCFLKIIIENDTIMQFKQRGNPIDNIQDSSGGVVKAISNINDSTWLFIMSGGDFGHGDERYHEIFKTSDNGETYRQVYKGDTKPAFGLQDIEFRDELNGIATGTGITLVTTDGGENWEINRLYYDIDWTKEADHPWTTWIDYIGDQAFLCTWVWGIYKWEDSVVAVKDDFFERPKLYPNPVQVGKLLSIENMYFFNAIANIYDIHGQQVDSFYFHGNAIPIREVLPPGAYILIVEENGKYPVREKFIVE